VVVPAEAWTAFECAEAHARAKGLSTGRAGCKTP
jgi:hypothetical protein